MTLQRVAGDALELLDQPAIDISELRTSLRDIERLNSWFGGTAAIVNEVQRLVHERGLTRRITVLDIGTGGADIPRALASWGRRSGLPVRIVACDLHPQVAAIAAHSSRDHGAVALLRADALALPVLPGHFDFVTCSLMLHHLPEEDVVSLIEKLRDIPRHALIVCDLERSRRALAGVWLATRAVCRSRLTRHDGPLSVLRAYMLAELRALSVRAGCSEMRWFRRACFRAVGVLEK
jgi:2-polyprenyl-3-methyl-5-hydroxy-6-metoxy-1,4-benzoquinol methylase